MTKTITIILTALLICSCSLTACADGIEDVYAMTTVVVGIDYEEDAVTCQDFNGYLWVFYGVEDWLPGDVATLMMWNAETDIIFDDEVLDVFYSGYLEGEALAQWCNH